MATDVHTKDINGLTNKKGEIKMFVKKGTYIALCLFLGGAGIHKFYAGKWVVGILYLLFSWTYIPVCLALFDLLFAMFKRTNEYGEIWV